MTLMRNTLSSLMLLLLLCPTARAGNEIIENVIKEQAGRIPAAALQIAFDYYQSHQDQIANKNYLTIVDFNLPSTEKRMHIIDMQTGKVEDLYVAHGKNTGNNFATAFSNKEGSNQSSLGLYLAGEEYIGKHGLSMRLDGVDPSNDNARKRDIVLHGATYVSEEFIKKQGRLGRSSGCLAVEQPLSARIVKQLQGKSVILVYRDANGGKDKDEKIEAGKEGS
jgi:hypothetical protein